MLTSMQGRLPGVQISTDAAPGGGNSAIRIRGISTVNGSDPLYVIDGIATNENLNSLNPSDIESIQVLKDASSASIYGSRAANGVIIITTKRGKKDRLSVNINYSASLQTIARQHKMLNAEQWGNMYGQAALNAGLTPSHPFYPLLRTVPPRSTRLWLIPTVTAKRFRSFRPTRTGREPFIRPHGPTM